MNFVDNPRRTSRQKLVVKGESSCSHEICRFYGTQDDYFSVHTFVALDLQFSEIKLLLGVSYTYHNTDSFTRVQGSVGLRNLVVQTGLSDHGDENVVCATRDFDAFRGYLAQDTIVKSVLWSENM